MNKLQWPQDFEPSADQSGVEPGWVRMESHGPRSGEFIGHPLTGRIDEIRITKGVACYKRPPWYVRFWRWCLVKLGRRDPYFDSVVFMEHFDSPVKFPNVEPPK